MSLLGPLEGPPKRPRWSAAAPPEVSLWRSVDLSAESGWMIPPWLSAPPECSPLQSATVGGTCLRRFTCCPQGPSCKARVPPIRAAKWRPVGSCARPAWLPQHSGRERDQAGGWQFSEINCNKPHSLKIDSPRVIDLPDGDESSRDHTVLWGGAGGCPMSMWHIRATL